MWVSPLCDALELYEDARAVTFRLWDDLTNHLHKTFVAHEVLSLRTHATLSRSDKISSAHQVNLKMRYDYGNSGIPRKKRALREVPPTLSVVLRHVCFRHRCL